MNIIIQAVVIGLGTLFLTIPYINRNVFHTVNITETIVEGRERLAKIEELKNKGLYQEARDSARSLIEDFRNDSLAFFAGDISSWDSVLTLLRSGASNDPAFQILRRRIREDDTLVIRDASGGDGLPATVRLNIVAALNAAKNDPQLITEFPALVRSATDKKVREALRELVSRGIVFDQGSGFSLKQGISPAERRKILRFNMALFERELYSSFIDKNLKRNMDWASEYIVQTAMYHIGTTYQAELRIDDMVRVYDSLVFLYPTTIYAEPIFLQSGAALLDDGRQKLAQGDAAKGRGRLRRAMDLLERIERNREISKEFPKYRYSDLEVGKYVNVDEASKAKHRIKEKTTIYSLKQAKEEMRNKRDESESGYVLEDAVKSIGQCYMHLGRTDSARMQFNLLLSFFPESDNLDNAQKLIADSYMKDGDLAAASGDSADPAVRKRMDDAYRMAVKEYQKFVNVYPQSDLVAEAYIAMGDVYHKLGDADRATGAFTAALEGAKEIKDQARVQLQIGNYYFERRMHERAIEAYAVILKNFLSTEVAPNAQYLMGECYEMLGDTMKAIEAFDIIVKHYKRSTFFGAAAYKMGMWYFVNDNYKEALRVFKLGRAYDPTGKFGPQTQRQRGMVWKEIAEEAQGGERENAYKEAIKQFEVVVQEFKGDRDADLASLQIVQCYQAIGNVQKAQEASREISSRDILLSAIKIFRADADESGTDELAYWQQAYDDAQEDEERATALYEIALVQTDKLKEYEEAIKNYNRVIELTGDRQKKLNARINLSRVYGMQKRYTDAQKVLGELLTEKWIQPEIAQQLKIQLYDSYFNAEDLDKGFEGFEGFAASYPENRFAAFAHYRASVIMGQRGEHAQAIERLRKTLDKYPDSDYFDKIVFEIGQQMIHLGQYRKAIDYLERYVADNPDAGAAANIYLKIAETCSEKLGQTNKALRIYTHVVREYEEDSPLYYSYAAYYRGLLLKKLGRDRNAIASLELVQKTNPSLYRASQAEIGKILAKTDPTAAIRRYENVVKESETPEDSARAMIGIGDVYSAIGRWKKAAREYEAVYNFYQGTDTTLFTGALVKWVDALINSKQYRGAIRAAKIMQKRFPDNDFTVNTYYYEATAYFSMERYSSALRLFNKLIRAKGASPQVVEVAYYQRGDCYYFQNKFDSAVRYYDEYRKKYPKGRYVPRALYMQGNSYWRKQDFKRASVKFERVVQRYPKFGDICNAMNFYAFSLSRTGKRKAALTYYNKVRRSGTCSAKAKQWANEQREAIMVVQ